MKINKKYEFTGASKLVGNITVNQIRAVRDFGNVKAGEVGGWIENKNNLSHDGTAWVSDNAMVFGDAKLFSYAMVFGDASISGDTEIFGDAKVFDDAEILGSAEISGNAQVCGRMCVKNENQIITIDCIDRGCGCITFANNNAGDIAVACGCFYGTIDEFAAKVKETHGDSVYAKEYEAAIELAKIHIMR